MDLGAVVVAQVAVQAITQQAQADLGAVGVVATTVVVAVVLEAAAGVVIQRVLPVDLAVVEELLIIAVVLGAATVMVMVMVEVEQDLEEGSLLGIMPY